MVVDRVLQDALKQHRQLGGRLVGVFFRQFQHGVLHDVERGVLVARREHRLLERASLDVREKSRNFLWSGQFGRSGAKNRTIIGAFALARPGTRRLAVLQDSNPA